MRELAHNALKYYVRKFPVERGKRRVLAALWRPLSFGKYVRYTTLRQANVKVKCDLTKWLQRTLYFLGSYEEENCAYWIRLSRNARVIFDVGANVGLYSLLASATNPKASVHAFEPTPEIYDSLVANIRLNGMGNITPNRLAIGRTGGTSYLHRCTGTDGSNDGMNYTSSARLDPSDETTAMVSIEEYCKQEGIGHIDLLKIDIEGGEFDALVGAQGMLSRKAIGCIFVELIEWAANRNGASTGDIKRLLVGAGYQTYKLQGRRLVPVSLSDTHDGDNVIAFARGQGPGVRDQGSGVRDQSTFDRTLIS